MHQSLARGVVDCAITGPSSANSASWPEVTTHVLPVAFQVAIQGYGMNLDTWNRSDLFEVVSQLERLAVTLSVQRMSIADRATLRRMHDRMMNLYRCEELRDCFQADYEIHNFIVEKSANSVLSATHSSLMARTRRGRYVALFDRSRWDEAMSEHERIMEAIERREADRASDEMFSHITRTGAVLRQTLIKERAQTAT